MSKKILFFILLYLYVVNAFVIPDDVKNNVNKRCGRAGNSFLRGGNNCI